MDDFDTRVIFTISNSLLKNVDQAAKDSYMSRAAYIRRALAEALYKEKQEAEKGRLEREAFEEHLKDIYGGK